MFYHLSSITYHRSSIKIILTIIFIFPPTLAFAQTNLPVPFTSQAPYGNWSQPVIIPAYGKALKNPRFRNGGPEFHTLVISGYDDDKKQFITQEPGTSYGLDFRYNYDTLINAIRDFLPNKQTKNGRKVAIFTSKTLKTSADADGDKDGLIKSDELKYGTITWLKDSDGDGYSDGDEVKNGFSPIKKFKK